MSYWLLVAMMLIAILAVTAVLADDEAERAIDQSETEGIAHGDS